MIEIIITLLAAIHLSYNLYLSKKKMPHSDIFAVFTYVEVKIARASDFIKGIGIFYLVFLGLLLCVDCLFIIRGNDADVSEAEILMVLGHQLDKDEIGICLKNRLDKAVEELKGNKKKVIVTGGYTGGSISEAKAMSDYLISKGIAEERILLEEESTTTIENFRFCLSKYPEIKKMKVGVISSEYHLARAKAIAKKEGYGAVKTTASKSELMLLPYHMTLEKYLILTKK